MYVTASPSEEAALRTHLAINASVQRARDTDGPDTRRHDQRRIAHTGTLANLRAAKPPREAPRPPRLLALSGRVVDLVGGLLRVAR